MNKADDVVYEYAKEHGTLGYDYNQIYDAVKYGYEQAEKDLTLTWEDVAILVSLHLNMMSEYQCETVFSSVEVFKETLRRFNEQRNK